MAKARRTRSLQFQLVALISAIVALASVVIGAVTMTAVRSDLLGRVDEQVEISLRTALGPEAYTYWSSPPPALPGEPDLPGGPRFGSLSIAVLGGVTVMAQAVSEEGVTAQLTTQQVAIAIGEGSAEEPRTVDLGELGKYRVASQEFEDPEGTVLLVGQSLSDVSRTTHTLLWSFVATGVAAVALASLLGAFMVKRALRPLESLRRTAADISKTPLTSGSFTLPARVSDQEFESGSEVGDLAQSFNQMLDHVERALGEREASETKLKRFAADASHELRTPLATISGYSEYAERSGEELPEPVAQSLGRIRSESARMTGLVEDLLLLARLDAKHVPESQACVVAPVLLECVADARALSPDLEWLVEMDAEDGELRASIGEASLRRILTNLLANAAAHATGATRVKVSLSTPASDRVLLQVEDNGAGVPPELAPYIFDRFVRGDDARTPVKDNPSRSTGLGLAITDELVRAAGGWVGAQSEPGHTVFSVALPRVP